LEESANVLAQEFDLDVFISTYNHSALGLQGIKATMKASTLAYLRWLAFLLALFLALPVNAYDNIPFRQARYATPIFWVHAREA